MQRVDRDTYDDHQEVTCEFVAAFTLPRSHFQLLLYSATAVRSLSPVMNQEAAARERFVVSDAIVIAFATAEIVAWDRDVRLAIVRDHANGPALVRVTEDCR